MPVNDEDLLLYDAGALDEGERRTIEGQLGRSPLLQRRLETLRDRLPSLDVEPSPWRIPPAGATWELGWASTGTAPAGPHLEMPDRDDADDRLVVVLARQDARWQVVWPTEPDQLRRLSQLESTDDGSRLVPCPPGLEARRWAVALPPVDLPIDWRDPQTRWRPLQRALHTLAVPATSIDADVDTLAMPGGNTGDPPVPTEVEPIRPRPPQRLWVTAAGALGLAAGVLLTIAVQPTTPSPFRSGHSPSESGLTLTRGELEIRSLNDQHLVHGAPFEILMPAAEGVTLADAELHYLTESRALVELAIDVEETEDGLRAVGPAMSASPGKWEFSITLTGTEPGQIWAVTGTIDVRAR